MRLTDLNPTLHDTVQNGVLEFDCPLHPASHRISVPIATDHEGPWGAKAWRSSGEFPDSLTLEPSILAHTAHPKDTELREEMYQAASICGWHGFVRGGEIVHA